MGSVSVTSDNLTHSGNRVLVRDESDQVASLQVCVWEIIVLISY